ncbi:MAG: hypothetical protein ABFR82_01310 [Nitrospirota bacterium]
MKVKIRKTVLISFIVMIMFSFTYMAATVETYASDANVTDNVYEGKMNDITKSYIIVDNMRFDFCTGISFYFKTKEIPFEDLSAATHVELYEGNGCVNKIVVSMFAH